MTINQDAVVRRKWRAVQQDAEDFHVDHRAPCTLNDCHPLTGCTSTPDCTSDADSDVNLIELATIQMRVCGAAGSIQPDKPPRIKDKVGPHGTPCGDCSCLKLKKDYRDDVEIKFKTQPLLSLIGDVPDDCEDGRL